MPSLTFIVEENDTTGDLGFRPANQPNFDPYGAMATIHDVLEHFADTTEDPADEFQALGAALYIRGNGGYWSRGYTPHAWYHLNYDVVEIYMKIESCEAIEMTQPVKRRNALRDQYAEEQIDLALAAAQKALYANEEGNGFDAEEMSDRKDNIDSYLASVRHWMRVGYARAAKRYAGLDTYDIVELWRRIEDRLNKIKDDIYEGGKVKLIIRPRNDSAKIIYDSINGKDVVFV